MRFRLLTILVLLFFLGGVFAVGYTTAQSQSLSLNDSALFPEGI